MAFIKFISAYRRGAALRITRKPFITLSRIQITFSASSLDTILKGIDYIELYYDADVECIGMKPCPEGTEGACKILKYKDRAVIGAKEFIEKFELKYLHKLPVLWDGQLKMFLVAVK